MKFSAFALLSAAAVGVSAHPSHGHQHMHRSIEARNDFVKAVRPPPPPPPPAPTTKAPPPPPKPSAAVAQGGQKPKPPPAPADKGGVFDEKPKVGGGKKKAFCDGENYLTKRATLDQIMYQGNIGAPGKYGCNIMEVDGSVAEQYKYLQTYKNTQSKPQECACWLKVGADLGINGFFSGNEALKFTIPAGGKSYIVADENSQGGCACGVNSLPLTDLGQFASTWAEWDFGNESNNQWSGADASCLVSAALGLDIPAMNLCGHGTCSTIYQGGKGKNAYLGGMEDLDGIGLNIPAGKVRLTIEV